MFNRKYVAMEQTSKKSFGQCGFFPTYPQIWVGTTRHIQSGYSATLITYLVWVC